MKSSSRIIKKHDVGERSKSFDAFFAEKEFLAHQKKVDAHRYHINQLIEKAEAQAEAIINDAKKQAMVEQQHGFEEGLRQGLEHIKPLEKLLQTLTDEVCMFKEQYPRQLEPQVVQLVMYVCHKIIKDKLEKDHEIVLRTVRHAFKELTDKQYIKIRVHKKDYALMQKFQAELLEQFHEIKKLEVVTDDSVDQGGCIIDTNEGSIDATLKTQIQKMVCLLTSESKTMPTTT